MKRIVFILSIFTLFSCKTLQAQPPQKEGGIGSVKTEQYQAEFEKKQSITDLLNTLIQYKFRYNY
jgi:hypothetical protein